MAFADYKKGAHMNTKYIWSVLLCLSASATQIYIENWSTFPVTVSKAVIPGPSGSQIINTNLNVQPGQSLALHTSDMLNNFNEISIEFNVDGYTKNETLFFPDESTQEASLAFSDSGYKRSPFNILKRK